MGLDPRTPELHLGLKAGAKSLSHPGIPKVFFFFLRFYLFIKDRERGIPGWRSGLAPAFGPGHDPGDPGSNPTSGSRCMEPASPSAYVSASLCVSFVNK